MVLAPQLIQRLVVSAKSQYSLWSCSVQMAEGICISKLTLPWCSESKREGEASFSSMLYVQHADYFFIVVGVLGFFFPLRQTDFSPKRETFESCWGRANSHPWKGPSMEITTGWALGPSVDSSRVRNVSFGLLISSLTQHLSFQSLLNCTWCLETHNSIPFWNGMKTHPCTKKTLGGCPKRHLRKPLTPGSLRNPL